MKIPIALCSWDFFVLIKKILNFAWYIPDETWLQHQWLLAP